jgi:hypothetical protein
MKKTLPKARSEAAVLEDTSQALARAGVETQTQAQFHFEIANAVIGSKLFVFSTLQPEIKIKPDQPWIYAYTIVFQILEEWDQKVTLATIRRELRNEKVALDIPFLQRRPASQKLKEVIEARAVNAFRARVLEFAELEGLITKKKPRTGKSGSPDRMKDRPSQPPSPPQKRSQRSSDPPIKRSVKK